MTPENFAGILLLLLRIYDMVLLARILMSWIPMDPDNPLVEWLIKLTDPVLVPAREILSRILDRFGVQLPIDFSPIIVFLLIGVVERSLVSAMHPF